MPARVRFAALAAAASAATVVWQSAILGTGTLRVFSDDSYSLSLETPGGEEEVWLASGPTMVHLDGGSGPAWFTSAAAAGNGACTEVTDVDCRGNDLYDFDATGPADCCANCSATSACGAWTWTGDTSAGGVGGGVGSLPPWANRCYIKTSCAGATPYAGHTSGYPGVAATPLTRVSAGATDGGGWAVTYRAGGVPLVASFVPAAGPGQPFLFSLAFPKGATGVNITAAVNTTTTTAAAAAAPPTGSSSSAGSSARYTAGEFAASAVPSTQFPVFTQAPNSTAAAALGYLSWQGRFFQAVSAATGGAAAAFTAAAVGAEGGPIVLFDGNAAAGPLRRVAVVSPLSHFKSTMMGASEAAPGGGAAACGVSGYVTTLPAGYNTTFGVVLGTAGITDTVHAWGAALQQYAGSQPKLPDPASTALTVWTDNGAYYDFYAYEPDITSKGVPEDILIALYETYRNGTYPGPPIPATLLMLDAYWYPNVRANGNCALNFSVWDEPFPSGFGALTAAINRSLIIYNGPQCGNSTYGGAWPMTYSLYWDQGWGSGVFANVEAAAAYDFYAALFTSIAGPLGVPPGFAFTQDFLDFQGLLFPQWLEDAEGNAPWMEGQAGAAHDASVAVQYCMAEPADILQSVAHSAVTNARASQDYSASGDNWRIGSSSLLLSSVGLRASKDNFWTSCCGDRGGELSPFLVAAVATLSHGPVGFADALGATNPAVLWPTMTLNGTLLHASRPATAVDATFIGGLPLSVGDVRVTHSAIPSPTSTSGAYIFYSVLAVGLPAEGAPLAALVADTDLWPALPVNSTYWVTSYNVTACATAGAAATLCASVLGANTSGTAVPAQPPPPDVNHWQLATVGPVLPGGWYLVGESGKFVPVSPDRFTSVAADGGGMTVGLRGAPLEVVTVSYIRPPAGGGSGKVVGTVQVAAVTLDAAGSATARLQ